ncbi:MAG TPA: L,D-transpeptidase family protein [Bryobacteraceae bacterium]|nr:L,D-transpeptidase family protein [Bryobacteraceae bacterium]
MAFCASRQALAPLEARSTTAVCNSELCRLVSSGKLSDLRWPDFSDYRAHLQDFYEPASYAFAWTNHGAITRPAIAMIQVLKRADTKGLAPEDYDSSSWPERVAILNQSGKSPSEVDLARFDLALTVSVMRYVSDLHSGRANPGLFHKGFDLDDGEHDLARFVRQQLVAGSDLNRVLESVEPPYAGYRRTLEALRQYVTLAREDRAARLPVPKKTVDPGTEYSAIAPLTDLLRRLRDLPQSVPIPVNSAMYGEPLVTAVKHFQARHGLEPDGRLGKATLAQLNTPLNQRVHQLQLTLERWRWVPHSFPHPPIVVNIPEFRLRALNGNYASELDMKVVVGGAYRHQTPIFEAEMKYLIFRPYWEVPRSILRAELLPKIEKDTSYFVKHGYEVVNANSTVISKGALDEEILGALRAGKLRIRQVPGPENALGSVKFVFPNPHNVYLHGTPSTELFARFRRDFSHGCIRVEKPAELAAWVLRDKPEWTRKRILDAMNGSQTLQVTIPKPIPVVIVYATAVAEESGEVDFFEDIYGQDAELERWLAKGYPTSPWQPTSGAPGRRPRE